MPPRPSPSQLELEVDGDKCAHGGRFVWFNSRLQKVVEIGLSDEHVAARAALLTSGVGKVVLQP